MNIPSDATYYGIYSEIKVVEFFKQVDGIWFEWSKDGKRWFKLCHRPYELREIVSFLEIVQ